MYNYFICCGFYQLKLQLHVNTRNYTVQASCKIRYATYYFAHSVLFGVHKLICNDKQIDVKKCILKSHDNKYQKRKYVYGSGYGCSLFFHGNLMDSSKTNFALGEKRLVKEMKWICFTIVLLERDRESKYALKCSFVDDSTHWSPHRCLHILIGRNMCIVQINSRTNPHTHKCTRKKVNLQSFGKPVLFREQNKFFGHACAYI